MVEIADLRVNRDYAPLVFTVGPRDYPQQTVFRAKVVVGSALYDEVGRVTRELRAREGEYFFYGWTIKRTWSKREWDQAEYAQVRVPAFEPAGQECGTVYDETSACEFCGCCAKQVGDLVLDLRKMPKTRHIARTIANEVVVTQELAERLLDAGLTGFELGPVRHKARYQDDPIDFTKLESGRELIAEAERTGIPYGSWQFVVWLNRPEQRQLSDRITQEYADNRARRAQPNLPVWHQLRISHHVAKISPPTVTGMEPFDEDPEGRHRCPLGHKAGLNLLSALSIERSSLSDVDIQHTEQYLGTRRGLLRPYRSMIISRKFLEVLRSIKSRGLTLEIVNLV